MESAGKNSTVDGGKETPGFDQNIIVMRHGHRLDNFDGQWETTAERPWDPPLFRAGFTTASAVGGKLKKLSFPIHRVFVSPFLRCVQTASEVVAALCAVDESDPKKGIDSSRVKISIEYGLCEMLNQRAIRANVAPKDGHFIFNISELETILPAGAMDNTAEQIYAEMPQWEEEDWDARTRYKKVVQALADKYPSENLLIVTHGEGVGTFASFVKRARVYDVKYCGYAHARRRILFSENKSYVAESFQLLNIGPDEDSVCFVESSMSDDV
ncbi:hypothetical protein Ancab_037212 [Ancistrocladus abbreviatus]